MEWTREGDHLCGNPQNDNAGISAILKLFLKFRLFRVVPFLDNGPTIRCWVEQDVVPQYVGAIHKYTNVVSPVAVKFKERIDLLNQNHPSIPASKHTRACIVLAMCIFGFAQIRHMSALLRVAIGILTQTPEAPPLTSKTVIEIHAILLYPYSAKFGVKQRLGFFVVIFEYISNRWTPHLILPE